MSIISRQKLIEELETEYEGYKNLYCKTFDSEYRGRMDGIDIAIKVVDDQPPADQWIPCGYVIPAAPATEDTFRDIMIKRKTGDVVMGWNNPVEDTWMMHTDVYGEGERITDAVEWKYPEPYKGGGVDEEVIINTADNSTDSVRDRMCIQGSNCGSGRNYSNCGG